jgi:hypothetical protein
MSDGPGIPESELQPKAPETRQKSFLRRAANVAKNVIMSTTPGGAALVATGNGFDTSRKPEEQKVAVKSTEKKMRIPDRILTHQEIHNEGDALKNEFTNLFKGDLDVKQALQALTDTYFDYSKPRYNGVITVEKGAATYTFDAAEKNKFHLIRREENINEALDISRGKFDERGKTLDKPTIEYVAWGPNASYDLFSGHEGELRANNSELTVAKGKELLAKTQKDFGVVIPPSVSNSAPR